LKDNDADKKKDKDNKGKKDGKDGKDDAVDGPTTTNSEDPKEEKGWPLAAKLALFVGAPLALAGVGAGVYFRMKKPAATPVQQS